MSEVSENCARDSRLAALLDELTEAERIGQPARLDEVAAKHPEIVWDVVRPASQAKRTKTSRQSKPVHA